MNRIFKMIDKESAAVKEEEQVYPALQSTTKETQRRSRWNKELWTWETKEAPDNKWKALDFMESKKKFPEPDFYSFWETWLRAKEAGETEEHVAKRYNLNRENLTNFKLNAEEWAASLEIQQKSPIKLPRLATAEEYEKTKTRVKFMRLLKRYS